MLLGVLIGILLVGLEQPIGPSIAAVSPVFFAAFPDPAVAFSRDGEEITVVESNKAYRDRFGDSQLESFTADLGIRADELRSQLGDGQPVDRVTTGGAGRYWIRSVDPAGDDTDGYLIDYRGATR
ncbi:MAG: hypothetical protein U5K37_12695 [Natrialbaceae archaeon]|nr:hypothetical protein [Natrialbaceae archaeon]